MKAKEYMQYLEKIEVNPSSPEFINQLRKQGPVYEDVYWIAVPSLRAVSSYQWFVVFSKRLYANEIQATTKEFKNKQALITRMGWANWFIYCNHVDNRSIKDRYHFHVVNNQHIHALRMTAETYSGNKEVNNYISKELSFLI